MRLILGFVVAAGVSSLFGCSPAQEPTKAVKASKPEKAGRAPDYIFTLGRRRPRIMWQVRKYVLLWSRNR